MGKYIPWFNSLQRKKKEKGKIELTVLFDSRYYIKNKTAGSIRREAEATQGFTCPRITVDRLHKQPKKKFGRVTSQRN